MARTKKQPEEKAVAKKTKTEAKKMNQKTEEAVAEATAEKKKIFSKNEKLEKALKESEEKKALLEKALEEAEAEKERLQQSVKEMEAKLAEAADRHFRQMAEFDNFRKRTEREKAVSYERGAGKVLEKLLPVVDSFERGLGFLDEEDKGEPFEIGMIQVYKQLDKFLDDLEVKPIPAVGESFNLELHNAVFHEEDPSKPENMITQEFQKGYTFRGNVIRYSMVKVVN